MVKETIDTVREAEQNAAMIEKGAIRAGEKIILKATKNAQALIASLREEAFLNIKKQMECAIKEGNEMLEKAENEAAKDIQHLEEHAKQKEQEAISYIISEIIKVVD